MPRRCAMRQPRRHRGNRPQDRAVRRLARAERICLMATLVGARPLRIERRPLSGGEAGDGEFHDLHCGGNPGERVARNAHSCGQRDLPGVPGRGDARRRVRQCAARHRPARFAAEPRLLLRARHLPVVLHAVRHRAPILDRRNVDHLDRNSGRRALRAAVPVSEISQRTAAFGIRSSPRSSSGS